MTESALIIFLRKPDLGKVKTRLAKDIGNEKALIVYKHLLTKTFAVCEQLDLDLYPFFTPHIPEDFHLNNSMPQIQEGKDLGECMLNAFDFVFKRGYKKVVVIGSDCYRINTELLNKAFSQLNNKSFVIGPSEDGGYYLLGMKQLHSELFKGIAWSREDVFEKTIEKIPLKKSVATLEMLNDIDNLDDLKKEPELYKMVNDE